MKPEKLHIGTRLKNFRKESGMKMPAIAKLVKIPKESLYQWERGTKPSDMDAYLRLKAFLDRREKVQSEEKWILETQKPFTLRLPLDSSLAAVPQTDGKAAPGTVILINGQPELIVDRLSAPFVGSADGVLEVRSSYMEPYFPTGCRIAISRLQDDRILNWGAFYFILDINWNGIIRRIYQSTEVNSILLVSNHPDKDTYPSFDRSRDHIAAIFKIVATIHLL